MENNVNRQIEHDCVAQMWSAFMLHFIQEVLTLTIPLVTSWMIGDMADSLIGLDLVRIRSRFVIFLLAFFLDVLVQPLIHLWENLVLTKQGFGYCNQMFCRYLHLPTKKAKGIETAALVERIDTDTTSYYFLLMEKWTRPFTFFIYLVLLIFMFCTEHFPLFFIFIMFVLAAIPVLRAAVNGHKKAALYQVGRDYEEEREGMEYGMFGARDFLNGFGLGKCYIARLHRRFQEYTKNTASAQDKMGAADLVFSYLCAYGVPLCVIAMGAILILNGSMGIGVLLAGYLVMPTLTNFYENFEELVLNIHKEKTIRARLEIFYAGDERKGEVSELKEEETAVKLKEIRLKDVGFAYPNARETVFEKYSLHILLFEKWHREVERNPDNCLMAARIYLGGANGAGKSTLLLLLSGIYEPDTGEIVDESGKKLYGEKLRKMVSLQEQDGGLFSTTVAENLFVSEKMLAEAENILRAMGFEKSMDTVLEEKGGNLSPGERKKLLLVRTLFNPAPILAFDEPLNHLDEQGKEVFLDLLKKEKRPVLMVSHTFIDGILWREIQL